MREQPGQDAAAGGDPAPDPEADLFAHLGEAVRRLDRGDAAGAVPPLRAFLREVETLECEGTLAPDAGEALTEAVTRLMERLGGRSRPGGTG